MARALNTQKEDWVQHIESKDEQTVRVTVSTSDGNQAFYQVYRYPAFSHNARSGQNGQEGGNQTSKGDS